MKLSIAVPWYRSPQSAAPLYERCLAAFERIPEFDELEFVFVEDGGGDETWSELVKLGKRDKRVKAVRLSRNFGQHHALTACLDLCDGDWVVTMDCDLQDRPEEIPALWKETTRGYDIVCARRGKRKDKLWKRLTSRYFVKFFNFLSGMRYDAEVANFRIMSAKVVKAYRIMGEATRNLVTQSQWLGFKTGYHDVKHDSRYAGDSSYSLLKLFALAADSLLAYSDKPLRLFCALGFLITLCGFCGVLWIIFRKVFFDIAITGWSSLIVSIWFTGGLIISGLGIIGLYVGRVYNETKKRPIYVIDERINL